ncbi:hypothetical protein PR002_g9011 [Phytophthora rubi]|uniref:Uncharacterized protein n=1 Tax=Phytophthora rubi TaxID=129364 RepID=A0A6A3MXX0_9STRA|nr:hypothetical protein PR002_g9011 [Phytophthora rubi]
MVRINSEEVRELDLKDMTVKKHTMWSTGGALVEEPKSDRHFGF